MKHLTLFISTLLPIFSLISCGSSPITPLDQSIEDTSTAIKPVDVNTSIKQLEKDLTNEHNLKVSLVSEGKNGFPSYKYEILVDYYKAFTKEYRKITGDGSNASNSEISEDGYVYQSNFAAEIYNRVCYLLTKDGSSTFRYYTHFEKTFRNGLKENVFSLDYFLKFGLDIPLMSALNKHVEHCTFNDYVLNFEGDIYYNDMNFNYGDGYIRGIEITFDKETDHLSQISFFYSGYMGYKDSKANANFTIKVEQYGEIALEPYAPDLLNEENAPYIIDGDYIKSKDKKDLLSFYPSDGDKYVRSVVVPEGTETLANYLYNDYKYISSVTLPNSLKTMGYGAFADCEYLKTINYLGTKEEWNILIYNSSDYWNASCPISKIICSNAEIDSIHYYSFLYSRIDNKGEYKISSMDSGFSSKVLEIPSIYRGLPVTELGIYSLSNIRDEVEKIILPASIKVLGDNSLSNIKLDSIEFKGTISEWEDVLSHSDSDWNLNSNIQQVICSDGIYYLNK